MFRAHQGRARRAGLLACLALALASAAPAPAPSVSLFDSEKKITILVGSSASGATNGLARVLGQIAGVSSDAELEAYGRLVAQYLGSHLPGAPRVEVRDLPGESGLAPLLYLQRTEPANATVLAMFDPTLLTDAVIGAWSDETDFSRLSWIGSMAPDFRICFARRGAGGEDWNDLAAGRDRAFGAEGLRSLSYIDARLLRSVFKRKVRPILGYAGGADIYYAIARGELDGGCASVSDLPSTWLIEGKVDPLVRLIDAPTPGVETRIPFIARYATSTQQRAMVDLLTGASQVGRPLVISETTPTAELNALRAGFEATMQDRAFLAAAENQSLPIMPTSGEAAQQVVRKLYAAPQALAAEAAQAVR